MILSEEKLKKIRQSLPELPDEKKKRFIKDYKLPEYDASVLTADKDLADFYEETVKLTAKPKETSNWFMTELLRMMNEEGIEVKDLRVKPEHFKELFDMMDAGKITKNIAKDVFKEVFKTGKSPSEIVKEKGLEVVTDESEIERILKEAIEKNPKAVEQYKNGKKGIMGFFIGQVMKATSGKADPKVVQKIFRKLMEE